MYLEGRGVPEGAAEAAKWFREAAEQGYSDAQFNLGTMYTHGQGLPQDYVEAMKWYGLAGEQGDANAQNSIGLMHTYGHGVPQNFVEAYIWFSLAASGGDQDGAKHRDLTASLMTKEQIIEAQFHLGVRYGKGQGVPVDTANSLKWLRTAAKQGHTDAQFALGLMVKYDAERRGVPVDDAEVAKCYQLAAEQGHPDAQANLGVLYARGDGVPTDNVRAYMWFSLSAAQGNQQAAKHRDLVVEIMTPAQIAEAQRLARVWKLKHGLSDTR